jgi:alanyl-tRNA synthetase
MTEHLYYYDSFLYEFEAEVLSVGGVGSRPALVLDRTAFYPTSGGQLSDTGWIIAGEKKARVEEVAERDDGTILHLLAKAEGIPLAMRVRGVIDADRRSDHMQQHSGQHVLSAAFVRRYNLPTVSFHMGVEACSIDLDTKTLTQEQARGAEELANEVIAQNRPVNVRLVTQEEAQGLGLRKPPRTDRDRLRLIDIQNFDLSACGGTHVSATGQIGCILLRKIEKVRQGWRVEFVCGQRAVATARRDYTTLAEAAELCSSQLWDVPQQVRKLQEDARQWRKSGEQAAEEIAGLYASQLINETPEGIGRRTIVRVFPDRDLTFIKLLAQKLTRSNPNVVALLGTTSGQPALIFAQSAGQPFHMGDLMKEVLVALGGRGGGSKDMAQGGPANPAGIESALRDLAERLRG